MNKLAVVPEGLTFDDVLIQVRFGVLKSRADSNTGWWLTENRFGEKIEYKFDIPVIAANMDSICEEKMMYKMCELGGLGILHRRLPLERVAQVLNACYIVNMPVHRAISVGSVHNDKERIDFLLAEKDITKAVMTICVDIAHGHSIHMKDTLEYIREKGFKGPIIAGNVCTHAATKDLWDWGASMVKVGVGPGSACTTRIKTGCGYPQLSAIANCAQSIDFNIYSGKAPNLVPIIADGGIREPGDAAKALAAGATAVMIGGMLAGTDCVPGWDAVMQLADNDRCEAITPYTKIVFRGMASKEARAAVGEPETNAEGKSFTVDCKPAGSTKAVILDIVEGIQSAMSYTGCTSLEEFRRNTEFVRISSTVENHPHFKG